MILKVKQNLLDNEPCMDETIEESESIRIIHKEWENLVLKMLKMQKAALYQKVIDHNIVSGRNF